MYPFRHQSLRKKLILISLITTSLTLLLANFAFMSLEYYLSRQDNQNKLAVLGQVIANRATAALTFADIQVLQNNLNTLKADPNVMRGCIFDAEQGC